MTRVLNLATALAVLLPCTLALERLGGWSAVAKVDKDSSQVLLQALGRPADIQNGRSWKLICVDSVVGVEKQVVSGMNYRFHVLGRDLSSVKTVKVKATEQKTGLCSDVKTKDEASLKALETQAFVVQVYEQVWTKTLKVTSVEDDDTTTNKSKGATVNMQEQEQEHEQEQAALSRDEQQQIEAWIQTQGLNSFGDAKGTMYTGGTPLFDEATGTTIDRFAYIVGRHPERPWRLAEATEPATVHAIALEAASPSEKTVSYVSLVTLLGVASGVALVVAVVMVMGRTRGEQRRAKYESIRGRPSAK